MSTPLKFDLIDDTDSRNCRYQAKVGGYTYTLRQRNGRWEAFAAAPGAIVHLCHDRMFRRTAELLCVEHAERVAQRVTRWPGGGLGAGRRSSASSGVRCR